MELIFRSLSEDRVGTTWQRVFHHGWPGWKAWYLDRAGPEMASVEKCRRMLRRYMPELETTWDSWVHTVGGDLDIARFLSFWSPPRYLVNCSQIAGSDADGPFLIRNYDLDPCLNEGTLLMTGWHGHRVIGMVEGMAGLSDGMNEAGLALSLTFGGRIAHGPGFGIPLIMRYVLQTCRDAQDALAALRNIPCHMSYNVTLIDRAGEVGNVMLSPDRPLIQRGDRWATNHQLAVEWPRHGRLTKTLERGEHLTALAAGPHLDAAALGLQFLAPPLHSRRYDEGFGTIFTAFYRPGAGSVTLMWSDGAKHQWRFDDFPHRNLSVRYDADGSNVRQGAPGTEVEEIAQRLMAIRNRSRLEALAHWNNPDRMTSQHVPTREQT